MCGIVGFTGPDTGRLLSRMNEPQVHRGPDDGGEFRDDAAEVSMGMRRLSIVDIVGGHQPMSNESGDVVIVFNGEIFNAPALRKELLAQGVRFISDHSDTEIILRLYEMIGQGCAARLNGMFAFVIYDRRQQLLYGARDPFGIKPLHLFRYPKGIAWASEIKSFFALPSFSGAVDSLAIDQYLGLQYVPGSRTIYNGVIKVAPGTQFVYSLKNQEVTFRKYFELPFSREIEGGTIDPELVRQHFTEAVQRWNMADVPVACSLSGGLDSAAIVASLAHLGMSVKTYTVGFKSPADQGIDELSAAREVAQLYGTDHHEIELDLDDLLAEIPRMARHLDEPYGGGLPSWFVFQYMAKDVKVAMTGTGGDELFSNYNKFVRLEQRPYFLKALYLTENYPRISSLLSWLSAQLTRLKKSRWPEEEETTVRDRHRREDASLFWSHPFGITFQTAHGTGICERLATKETSGLSAGRRALEEIFNASPDLPLRNRCAAVDFCAQLPDEFLLMTDRFSMAHSLEARTPFLDKEFVRFVLGIPSVVRLDPSRPKWLLREAFKDWLPPGYTDRRKKGFVLPVARWLRGPLRQEAMDLFAPDALEKDGFVRSDFRKVYYQKFLEGQTELAETVWTVFMLRQWQEHAAYRATS